MILAAHGILKTPAGGGGTPTYRSMWGYPTATYNPTGSTDDNEAISTGLVFSVKMAGAIHGIRWYKPSGPADTGPFSVGLYSSAGTSLGTKSVGTISGGGWQTGMFDTPITVTTSTNYIAAVYNPGGSYANTVGFFNPIQPGDSTRAPNGFLENTWLLYPASAAAGVGGNGRYNYATGISYPDETFNMEYYWTDVLFVPD